MNTNNHNHNLDPDPDEPDPGDNQEKPCPAGIKGFLCRLEKAFFDWMASI